MNPINVKAISANELVKCPSLQGKDLSTLKFLNYKYAGISIASIIEDNTQFDKNSSKDLIAALANLTVKVYGMNSVDFFHKDAHEGNIMYDPKDKHAYLIDFGHATKGSDKPLDPGHQHKGNYFEQFKSMCRNINFVDLTKWEDIEPAYKNAYTNGGIHCLVEYPELYYV